MKRFSTAPLLGACVVKHTNPCGAALAPTLAAAIDAAIAGDPIAAYGGILAVNGMMDVAAAPADLREGVFVEVIVAPEFEPAALEMTPSAGPTCGCWASGSVPRPRLGSWSTDRSPAACWCRTGTTAASEPHHWSTRPARRRTPAQLAAGAFLETVCRYVTSNAVIVGGQEKPSEPVFRLFGVGSGQVDRVSACRLAVGKAGALSKGAVAVGDAFFPLRGRPQGAGGRGRGGDRAAGRIQTRRRDVQALPGARDHVPDDRGEALPALTPNSFTRRTRRNP